MGLLVWIVFVVRVAPARAECWTRSDGVEVCSHDPVEWMALWWVWLVLLLIAGALVGYCDLCHGSTVRRNVDAASADEIKEPLLHHDDQAQEPHGQIGGQRGRIQPVYRYLD